MMDLLTVITMLNAEGLVPDAKLRRVRIHYTFWRLRAAGVAVMDAKNAVADAYAVELRTVEEYVYPANRYDSILQKTSA